MSGKGGVGKSTVAAYVALLLSNRGHRVGLLDADLHGPSIPHLLNITGGLGISREDGALKPYAFSEQLQVVSMEMVLGDRDSAVIWRGPLKISAIKQFISDIQWGPMDYLIIDSPPGTGDEPLTIAQTIPEAEALIVTTPQEISLADVRKSINFCHQVNMKMMGMVENMSGFFCPHCNQMITIFGAGGGAKMAERMAVPFLGEIPVDPEMVELGDSGELAGMTEKADKDLNRAYEKIIAIIERA
ncbi:MAG: Mrp/NBP35 family ATP-binding protein [Deltaproteobacteria bacterium]|nr:Mrp/NBP35 family ATP-binding protein [Deltaproteobacteria bacterium]